MYVCKLLCCHAYQVFINPSVASLPLHAHLFGGHGCYRGATDNRDGGQACKGEHALPAALSALMDCQKPSNITAEDLRTFWTCKKQKGATGKRKLRV